MELSEFHHLMKTHGTEYMGGLALNRLKPYLEQRDYADEIVARDGSVVFRFGGYEYSLWCYGVLMNPIEDVLDAVIRVEPYYRAKLKNKKIDEE